MRGFGSLTLQETDATILERLQKLYAEKLRPLEKKSLYHEMGEPALSDAWFESKPMVLLLGQYSVGKTSFIKYLLGRRYLGGRIGPEMTTDKFVAIMYGDAEKTTPGNALTSQPDTPFHSLKKYGTNFLNRLEATALPSPILKRVMLVDSPGVLSGQKQRDRGYEFNGVIKWFVQHSDRILLLFDAYKLDLSDEFKEVMKLLRDHEKKVRVVLNKADGVSPQDLMRVYGALMWMLGGIVSAAEVPRVYIGSFWDEPWVHKGMVELMEAEEGDLVEDLATLPQNNVMSKINEIARRARVVEAHTHLLAHLRTCVLSKWYGKSQEKERLCTEAGMEAAFAEVQRVHDLSRGDFPAAASMAHFLRRYDFADFYKPSQERSKKLKLVRELMETDIPDLISRLHTVQERQRRNPLQPRVQFRPQRTKRGPPPEALGDRAADTKGTSLRGLWSNGPSASMGSAFSSMRSKLPQQYAPSPPPPSHEAAPQRQNPPPQPDADAFEHAARAPADLAPASPEQAPAPAEHASATSMPHAGHTHSGPTKTMRGFASSQPYREGAAPAVDDGSTPSEPALTSNLPEPSEAARADGHSTTSQEYAAAPAAQDAFGLPPTGAGAVTGDQISVNSGNAPQYDDREM